MILIYGHRLYGRMAKFAGTCVAARFIHLYYLPLIPIGSFLVLGPAGDGQDRVIKIGFHWGSIGLTYLRTASVAAVALAIFSIVNATRYGAQSADIGVAAAAVLLAAGLIYLAWSRLGRLGVEHKAQRSVYYDCVGTFADVAHLGPAREQMRDKLLGELRLRGDEQKRGWREQAGDAACTDVPFLKKALTLCRLEWALAKGGDRAVLMHEHRVIFQRLAAQSPEILKTAELEVS